MNSEKKELNRYTVIDLWNMYQEKKSVLEDYTWDDLIIDLMKKEISEYEPKVSAEEEKVMDRGSEADQMADYQEEEIRE